MAMHPRDYDYSVDRDQDYDERERKNTWWRGWFWGAIFGAVSNPLFRFLIGI